uniref:Uncharacterized protein n=1 Tax=Trichogramma kaykai TaxID=54128 RepID=A0ABD2W1C4_9HYME
MYTTRVERRVAESHARITLQYCCTRLTVLSNLGKQIEGSPFNYLYPMQSVFIRITHVEAYIQQITSLNV